MSEKDLALEYAVANDTASNRFTIQVDSGPIRTDSRPQKRGPSGWSGLREHKMHSWTRSECLPTLPCSGESRSYVG